MRRALSLLHRRNTAPAQTYGVAYLMQNILAKPSKRRAAKATESTESPVAESTESPVAESTESPVAESTESTATESTESPADTVARILSESGIAFIGVEHGNTALRAILSTILHLRGLDESSLADSNPGAHPATKPRLAMLSESLQPVQKHGRSARNVALALAFAAASGVAFNPNKPASRRVGFSNADSAVAETGGMRNAVRGGVAMRDTSSNALFYHTDSRDAAESTLGASRVAAVIAACDAMREHGLAAL
jgi:hypothetical protein